MSGDLRIRPVGDADRDWVRALMVREWSGEEIVVHGVVHRPHLLPGFVAEDRAGTAVGLATCAIEGPACELVTLNALRRGGGIGTALLAAVADAARRAGCRRLWLVTTNDNVEALAFYQKRGLRLVAVHRDAVTRSRRLKPAIPLVAPNGIPLTDELELEMPLAP